MREKLEVKVIFIIFLLLFVGVVMASTFSISVEKKDMYEVSHDRMRTTSKIISKAIERSMLEADASFTKDLVDELKNISGYELAVYNYEGREAFNKASKVSADENVMQTIDSGRDNMLVVGQQLRAYMPLRNHKSCRQCHSNDKDVMGAIEMTISLSNEYARINSFKWKMIVGSALGIIVIGFVLGLRLRRDIIEPVKSLEASAKKMSEGDLSFDTRITSNDEIGRLDTSIKDSLHSISSILKRIKDVSLRVSAASDLVGKESEKVVESTLLESEAVADISSSVEELNVAIAEIADSTQSLVRASQDSAAAAQELAMSVVTVKDITHEVSEGIETTTSSIHQFSASIKEVVENANDLAKVSDETLSAVEEITTSVKEVEVSAKESALMSQKVMDDSSTLGITSIRKTMDGMEQIRASVSKTSDAITRLGGRSEEIGNILNVIDDITDQTTLLSLNAAILAAQAGEHGRGFSVVANEIKDLAERTALSTQEIDSLIKAVRQEVGDAVLAMKEGIGAVDNGMVLARATSSALNKILESARKSAEMSASIDRTTTEQAKTSRYVSDAIEKVRYMVEHIVKAMSEQSKGVQQIMEAAEKMRDASVNADNATEQQTSGSKQILKYIDNISDMSQQISRAINEQKLGSNQIWMSVEKIKDIPEENRDMAFRINKALRDLRGDADLINLEIERFSLFKEDVADTIEFGVVPFEPPAEIYRKFMPLVDYLSASLNKKITLRVESDYKVAVSNFSLGAVKLCFMNAVAYAELKNMVSVKPLVKTLVNGKPYHKAAIVTRKGSPIRSIADVRGKQFAFVDQKSTSGYMVPLVMLQENGLGLKDLGGHRFLGYHEDVIKGLLDGEFDAGAVMESMALRYKDEGISIVDVSAEIPSFVVCTGEGFDPSLASAISEALAALGKGTSEGNAVLDAMGRFISGFAKASDTDFDKIVDMVSKVVDK